jgi:hypothetical protein
MDWLRANQKTIPLNVNTVADLIAVLLTCPLDYPIRNSDSSEFCEINISTDGVDKEVSLY